MAQSRPPTPIALGRRADHGAGRLTTDTDLRWHPLPVALTRFIGREHEIAAVTRLLDETRLLTLTGSGGCGKTRLALAVATGLAAAPNGVCLVELAALSDSTLVPQMVATALGTREEPHRSLVSTLADRLRVRPPLLLLDNCEHLIVPVAALADALLQSCPNVHIFATSREPLGVPGEVTWRVPSLSLPDARRSSAENLLRSEAGQLFVDRVRLRQPAFTLTDEHATAIATICRRLDGMPLALELAAARAGALPIPQLATRLDDALHLLTHGGRTVAPRHRTLRATLDWSYALLTDDERTMLRRLAVFAGGCDLAAVEAVCAGNGITLRAVLPLLAQLVEKSLVQMEERGGEARYHLQETVRQYARERLEASGETVCIRQAHADWYLTFVERVGPILNGPEMVKWLDRLEDEHDNVRAALHWLLETGQEAPGLRFGINLFLFWNARSYVNEGRRWLDAFLGLPPLAGTCSTEPATRALAQYSAGRLAISQGDYVAASTFLEAALITARDREHREYMAYILTQLGHLALYQRDFTTAQSRYEEALPIREALGDRRGIAIVIGSLGRAALFAGKTAEARARLEESLAIFRQIVAHMDTVGVLCDLGYVAIEQRDNDRAYACFAEGLTSSGEWDIKQGSAQCLEGFAVLANAQEQPERALRLAGASAAIRRAINYPTPPVLHARLTRALDAARQTLGMTTMRAAFASGEAMTLAQASAEAFAMKSPAASANAPTDRRAEKERYGGLTVRERAVVRLIAAGKLNREIADALFVTEKTVEWHISNSLRKLGFRTRAELAVWAVTADLAPASFPQQAKHSSLEPHQP